MAEVRRTVQNLKPGKEYVLTVRAKNTDLNVLSDYSDAIRFTVPNDSTIPEVPSNLELVASFLNVMFVFDAVSDKDIQSYEYEVYKQAQITGTGPNWEIITGESPFRTGFSPSNVFVVSVDENTSLDNSSNPSASESPVYYFGRVRSVDTSGNLSAWTDIVVSGDTPLIDDEYVASLTASKITAGTIGAHEITLNGTNSIIKSSDYDGTYTLDGLGNRVWSQGTSGWVITGDGYSEFDVTNVRGTLSASSIVIDANNYWNADGTFKVGDGSQYVEWDGSNLTITGSVTADSLYINANNYWNSDGTFKVGSSSANMVWDNSSLTVSGAAIVGSTLVAGNPTGDGVSITGTSVLINTSGGSGSGAARLKFNTNASSGDNFIDSDKRLVLAAGGSGTKTSIYIGRQDGSARDIVNVDATDLQLNGNSVLTSSSLPSGTIWTSDNDGVGSGLNADLLDGNQASAFAASSHTHSYAPVSHSHSYLPLSGGTLTGSLTVPGGAYGLYSNGWIFANGNRIQWPGSGYGTLYRSTQVDQGNFRTTTGFISSATTLNGNGIYGSSLSITGGVVFSGLSVGFDNFVRISNAGGLQYSTSLRSTKKDVYSISELLDSVNEINPIQNLTPVIYKSIPEDYPDDVKRYHYGFIAEDVVEQMPETSLLGPDGELQMYDIDMLAPLLTAEVQRLTKMVEELYSQANPGWSPRNPRSESGKQESLVILDKYREYVIEQTQIREAEEARRKAEIESDFPE